MKLEEYVNYGVKAIKDRRAALVDEYNKTTNPLDRLSLRDRVEEIDMALNYFANYDQVKGKEE